MNLLKSLLVLIKSLSLAVENTALSAMRTVLSLLWQGSYLCDFVFLTVYVELALAFALVINTSQG